MPSELKREERSEVSKSRSTAMVRRLRRNLRDLWTDFMQDCPMRLRLCIGLCRGKNMILTSCRTWERSSTVAIPPTCLLAGRRL